MNLELANLKTKMKNVAQANKKALVVAAIALPVVAVQYRAIKNLNAFIYDKGLYSEFYGTES